MDVSSRHMMLLQLLAVCCMASLAREKQEIHCIIGQELDPETNRLRWVIDRKDSCLCTKITMGGVNFYTAYRNYDVTYYDTFLVSSCLEEIRSWLGCPDISTQFSIIGKPAEQSSSYFDELSADKAVNGNTSGFLHPDCSCSHTAVDEVHPWWRVDLENEHCISKVTILNRKDCCSERLENAVVRAGFSSNVTANGACGSPVNAFQAAKLGGIIHMVCDPPLRARYVSVDIPGPAILQLCEVTVEEFPLSVCPC